MAIIKPLKVFLAENNIKVRTYYDWRDRGYAPRTIKIGRGVFITDEDERDWLEKRNSDSAFAEQHIAELTLKLAESAVDLITADTPEAQLRVMWRTSGIAHDLISARTYRARISGDKDGVAIQDAERSRFLAINRDAIDAAKAELGTRRGRKRKGSLSA